MGLSDNGDRPQSWCSKFPGLPVADSTVILAKILIYFTLGGCDGPESRATITVI